MEIDPRDASASRLYYTMISLIVPRPIAWVYSRDAAGTPNLAPYSYFTGVTSRPPTLCFAVGNKRDGRPKDTARNILATSSFVVNVVPHALAPAMVETSGEYPDEVDEAELAGLHCVDGRVVGAPASLRCTLHDCVRLDDGGEITSHLIIGRIQSIWVDDGVLDEAGRVDPMKLDAVGRMGGASYCRTLERFDLKRP